MGSAQNWTRNKDATRWRPSQVGWRPSLRTERSDATNGALLALLLGTRSYERSKGHRYERSLYGPCRTVPLQNSMCRTRPGPAAGPGDQQGSSGARVPPGVRGGHLRRAPGGLLHRFDLLAVLETLNAKWGWVMTHLEPDQSTIYCNRAMTAQFTPKEFREGKGSSQSSGIPL